MQPWILFLWLQLLVRCHRQQLEQMLFQEADIRGITMPFTKHNYLITDPEDIPRAIAEAFYIASSGRPGPVLVDIAKDALQKETDFVWPKELSLPGYHPQIEPTNQAIKDAAALIAQSSKPVFYVGGGVIKSNASKELMQLAELVGAPVVTTLMALGSFPDSHPQHYGMPGNARNCRCSYRATKG